MFLLVDGYNVIHALPWLEKMLDYELKSAREALLYFCQRLKQQRGDIERVIVVFDGNSVFSGLHDDSREGIEIIFSEGGEEADTLIMRLIEEGNYPSRRIFVVTNDNELANHARAYAVGVLSAEAFEGLSRKKRSKIGNPPREEEYKIPPSLAAEITETYRRHLGLS